MTTKQLDKMRAGREAQLAQQRALDREAVTAYRLWLREERRSFAALKRARDTEADAESIENMRAAWHEVLDVMPRDLPADSSPAWS